MVIRVHITNIKLGGGTGGEREGDILLESMWEWGLLQEYFRVRHVSKFAPPMKTESGAAISDKEFFYF